MSINKTWTPQAVTITIEEVYPNGYTAPEGFREVAFRPPTSGDQFIAAPYGRDLWHDNEKPPTRPRIIVEAIPAPLRLSIVLEVVDPALNEWATELVEGKLVGGKLLGCLVVSVEPVK